MYNTNDLIKAFKKIATEAVDASKPTNICYGKVISANPIKIQVEQKLLLSKEQLLLTRNVTDYDLEIEANISTEDTKLVAEQDLTHKHSISGIKKIKIKNKLKSGEKVLLFRMQGGQKFVVLDRIGD